jgi:WD40 repeat protein
MGDSKYTNLSLPLCSESDTKSSGNTRKASKLVAGISGLVIFGYFMSSTYLSSSDASTINLNSSEARLAELVNQDQLKLVSTPDIVYQFGNPGVTPHLVLSKDNSLAAFVNSQDSIEVWDLHKKELVAQYEQDVLPGMLVLTPDGKRVISSSSESNGVIICSLEAQCTEIGESKYTLSSVFVSSDSTVGYANILGVTTWELGIRTFSRSHVLKVGSGKRLRNTAVTPDGKYIAMIISGADSFIRVYDTGIRSKKIASINESQFEFIKISDDGKILAASKWRNTIIVWNVETGELISKIEHEDLISYFDLSPDGRFIIIAFSSKLILYDLKANKILKEITKFSLKSVFTKDSKFLLVAYVYDIYVIDLETPDEVATLKNTEVIYDLYPSENSEYLLVSTKESVYLWNSTNLYN